MSLETSNSCGNLETSEINNLKVNDIINNITINEIVDNDFMDKDVSELVAGDFYLFHVSEGDTPEDTVTYFYKDGVVFYSSVSDVGEVIKVSYTKGSLQEFVDNI